ncbi:alpha/beta hydrolase [Skermanella stibiiresistens SB22]|uniref:Alpha/beta hydrolase n=1 Tax=Skermanella stibiiresistens SB22 TaxID=1385369 RepID=W9H2L7_9PROT|nr:alpha/beta hydrolase [Skermanella stibiiresistens]EWY38008.1 alpha/beta hydrolase [Skermanella stibiiresistens SB22]
MPFIMAAGRRLETRWIEPRDEGRPTLVFLHEGLGSIGLWRDFPDKVAAASRCGALVYSRHGYGRSERLERPRGPGYLHDEALRSLPDVLDAFSIADPVLIGHSDGASIALILAGSGVRRLRGAVVMAPHVFVEDITIAGIEDAKAAYRDTDLSKRLGRYHDDADATFRGWNDAWLDPSFRSWNIENLLPGIRCPLLAIQGLEDEYATLAQIDAIERQTGGSFERLDLPDCRHIPHRDQPERTLDAIARFIDRV